MTQVYNTNVSYYLNKRGYERATNHNYRFEMQGQKPSDAERQIYIEN